MTGGFKIWNISLTLDRASPVEADSKFGDVTVGVKLETRELSVLGIQAADKNEAIAKAEELANPFLDTLSWKHDVDLAIDPTALRAEEIGPDGRKHAHLQGKETISVSERVLIVLKDATGNVVEVRDSAKPGRIGVKRSEAAAYYRRARLSSDPFDRFRNFYLVAENVADRIRANKKVSRKLYEQKLLKLALGECFRSDRTPLHKVASSVAEYHDQGNIIAEVARLLYKGYRCQLNHAKASQNKKVPFDPENEQQVKAVLPLMEFIARSLLDYEERNL